MTDWNLGVGDNPAGDMLTDVLNVEHGHLVASGAYSALHSHGDEVDLLEAGDRNSEPVDDTSLDGPEFHASTYDGHDSVADEVTTHSAHHQEFAPLAHVPWLDASLFHCWYNLDPLKHASEIRSDVFSVSSMCRGSRQGTMRGKRRSAYGATKDLSGKHQAFFGSVRIR